jgi:hypothetical protein
VGLEWGMCALIDCWWVCMASTACLPAAAAVPGDGVAACTCSKGWSVVDQGHLAVLRDTHSDHIRNVCRANVPEMPVPVSGA